ncbi:MAG: hypothetical protein ICV68_08875 [Pyrinomonadaceae bacterium]|nr:hypothetical protein [Pyrinomonadaceae bacterium]
MKKKIYALSLTLALTLSLVAFISAYSGRGSAAAPVSDAVSALPASDIIVTVNTARLLSETLPTFFADNPSLLAKLNEKVERFNKETGVDLRTFDSLAVGLRFNSPSGHDFDAVVVARGHFNANQVIDAGFAAGEKRGEVQRREEQYEGKTIYIAVPQRKQSDKRHTVPANTEVGVNSNGREGGAVLMANPNTGANTSQASLGEKAETDGAERTKVVIRQRANDMNQAAVEYKRKGPDEIAIVALDANTIAAGDLKSVKAAIDASMGRSRVDDELVRMATQNPSALISFSGKIPPSMTEKMTNAKGGPEAKYLASIRQFYGSFNTVGTDAEAFVAVRTENASQASDISQALNAMKLLGGFSVARPSKAEVRSLADVLKDLSITATGNEVQIKLNLKQKDLAPFVR